MVISPSFYPLFAALLANVTAQVLKLFIFYFRSNRWDLHQVISCGGFPCISSRKAESSCCTFSVSPWLRDYLYS